MAKETRLIDQCLSEIFKNFIALKDDDLKRSQEVFKGVFDKVKKAMENQCNYFKKYSRQVLYAGSVYDGLKVSKLDEFDMDIVIRLPISYADNENGIIIENDEPGFVKLKITKGFDDLAMSSDWHKCQEVTASWRDNDKIYFLQSKFRFWMKSVFIKALNQLNNEVVVNGVKYHLKYQESGPAFTLNVSNDVNNEEFKLDVDLVPAIKFNLPRWPKGYKQIEDVRVTDWLVVPKPRKAIHDPDLRDKCWRLSFQEFEREMLRDCQNVKTCIRLVKKLRDILDMKSIASYYIKTVFLWKIHTVSEKKYWKNKLSFLYPIMVKELYEAIKKKSIPYFWYADYNLLESVKPHLLPKYEEQLKNVLDNITNVKCIITSLLTSKEIEIFKGMDIYVKILNNTNGKIEPGTSNIQSNAESNDSKEVDDEIVAVYNVLDKKIEELIERLNQLEQKFESKINRKSE